MQRYTRFSPVPSAAARRSRTLRRRSPSRSIAGVLHERVCLESIAMSGATYPRSVRLRKRVEFLRVQRGGARKRLRHLVVCWHRGGEGARFGLTVSRKVGSAVVRNRVKRRLRDAIRRHRTEVEGVDVVFIALPSAAMADYQALLADVHRALRTISAQPR